MTDRLSDDQLDREISALLERQADDVHAAPTATEMVLRITSRLANGSGAGLGPSGVVARSGWLGLVPARRPAVLLAVAFLLIALIGALVIAGALRDNKTPTVIPPITSTGLPSSTTPASPPLVVRPTPVVESGTASTTIGQLTWASLRGDGTVIPAGDIFATPDGYAAIEQAPDGRATKFWVSADGLGWSERPAPVPAVGPIGHGVANGEHWIWSTTEFRLWRSADFASWTEVSLEAFRPPTVAGLDWTFWPMDPTAIGPATVLPWRFGALLALDDLLGIPVAAGERLSIDQERENPALGDVRAITRSRITIIGPDEGTRERVGSIRVTLAGSIVTITDADRDAVVAEIDADVLGISPSSLAETLNDAGWSGEQWDGAVITDNIAVPMAYPLAPVSQRTHRDGFVDVFAIGGRFVGLTEGSGPGSMRAWASTNGRDWEPLGPPVFSSSAAGTVTVHKVLRRADERPEQRLSALVVVEERDEQHLELWSSADGVTWAPVGPVPNPGPYIYPVFAPSAIGGYLMANEDFRVSVSPTGAEWTAVDGLADVGAETRLGSGTVRFEVTAEALFVSEVALNGDRVLWVLRVEGG